MAKLLLFILFAIGLVVLFAIGMIFGFYGVLFALLLIGGGILIFRA